MISISVIRRFNIRSDSFRMLRVYIVLIFIYFFTNGYSQHDLNNQLLDQVLDDNNIGKNKYIDTIVILTHPIHDFPDSDAHFDRLKADYGDIDKSTYFNFRQNLDKGLKLNEMQTLDKTILIDTLIYKNYSEIFSKHRNIQIIEISNIGYSFDKNQAILYYGSIQSQMSAGGVFLLYEKRKSRWKLKKVFSAWAT